MLDQNADKTLHRAEDRPMQHHGHFSRVVLSHVFGAKPLWKLEVELQGAALPDAPDAVPQRKLDLRPVERAVAGGKLPREPFGVERFGQGRLRTIPCFI